jgi:SAM-dependent methyltransferase
VTDALKHYQGVSGEAYYAWQRQYGPAGGHIEARKFSGSIGPDDAVLDFGCGGGAMLKSLDCGRRIGVDINAAARREAAVAGVEVHASLSEIPPSSIDVVVSNHALEHVPEPFSVCCQLRDVLVPGGRLILCLPFDDWRGQRSYHPGDINHHLYTWNPLLIGHLLSDAGFEVASSAMLSRAWPPMWEWLDAHLSNASFDFACAVWARLRHRRQVIAYAWKPLPNDG